MAIVNARDGAERAWQRLRSAPVTQAEDPRAVFSQRKTCCGIRKVEPLERALKDTQAWITGQRQAQAATRTALPVRERDAVRKIEKFNPLADWSEADVWTYIRQYDVPVNPLHFEGFPSIGCEPCTRAITIGEDIRAGRWWWEDPTSKECGLHNSNLKSS